MPAKAKTPSAEAGLTGDFKQWKKQSYPACNLTDNLVRDNPIAYSDRFLVPVNTTAGEKAKYMLCLSAAQLITNTVLPPPAPGSVTEEGIPNGIIRQVDPDPEFIEVFTKSGGWSIVAPGKACPVLTGAEIRELNKCKGREARLLKLITWFTSAEFWLTDEHGVQHRAWYGIILHAT